MEYGDFIPIRDAKDDSDIGRFVKNRNAIYWQIRKRNQNGLVLAKAVFKGPDGEWEIFQHRPLYFYRFLFGQHRELPPQK